MDTTDTIGVYQDSHHIYLKQFVIFSVVVTRFSSMSERLVPSKSQFIAQD